MRLTEQSRYALRVLACCAEREHAFLKVADIAGDTGITEQNIFKLVKVLTKARFIETCRGPKGGVRLARPANSISVGHVIRAIEPRFRTCGPLRFLTPTESLSSIVERELDRVIGQGLASFIAKLDETNIGALVLKAKPANAA